MTHKERAAWMFLIIFLVTYIPYFSLSAYRGLPTTMPGFEQLWLYGITAVIQMVLIGLGYAWFALRHRADMRAPTDERDHAIELKGIRSAYYVLLTGAIFAGIYLPFVKSGWDIVQTMIFVIGLAQVIHFGMVALGYRRSA